MLKDIVRAKYLGGYKIEIEFEDGKTGVVDFENMVEMKGVFKRLRKIDYFKKFYLNKELGTLCWPDGQDIAPETIYEKLAA